METRFDTVFAVWSLVSHTIREIYVGAALEVFFAAVRDEERMSRIRSWRANVQQWRDVADEAMQNAGRAAATAADARVLHAREIETLRKGIERLETELDRADDRIATLLEDRAEPKPSPLRDRDTSEILARLSYCQLTEEEAAEINRRIPK
jgi:hypothetical protein